jgi:hypothetical protein
MLIASVAPHIYVRLAIGLLLICLLHEKWGTNCCWQGPGLRFCVCQGTVTVILSLTELSTCFFTHRAPVRFFQNQLRASIARYLLP